MKLGLFGCLSACLCIMAASCSSLETNENTVTNAQDTVSAIANVQPSGIPDHFVPDEPAHIARAAGDWDVNAYLGALTHLSVEPGYIIDYFYMFEGGGGHPFVYARPADKSPYASFEEYLANVPSDAPDSAGETEYANEYLDHIKIDDTREGYFEFVALRLMDDQFYQYWHAAYNDATIVCDADGLQRTLSAADSAFEGSGVPGSVRRAAAKIDLAPTVEFLDEATALVRLVIFSKWGGFAELRYTISRDFPHSIINSETQMLVEYDCGASF